METTKLIEMIVDEDAEGVIGQLIEKGYIDKEVPDRSELMDMDECMHFLHSSRMSIWRWIKEGKLKRIKIGSKVLFHADDVKSFIENHRDR